MARMNWDRVNRERNLPDYSERMDAAEARLRERAIERARTRAASNSRTGEPTKTAAAHPARKARPVGAKKSGNSSPIAKSTPKGKPQKVKATRKKARRKGALGLVQVRKQVVNPRARREVRPEVIAAQRRGAMAQAGIRSATQLARADKKDRDKAQVKRSKAKKQESKKSKATRDAAAAARAGITVEQLRAQRRAEAKESERLAAEARAMGITTKELRGRRRRETDA